MNWYYADAGKQAGPVDDAQFEALIGSAKIAPDTLVWHEGMVNWQPLREVRPAAAAPGATTAPAPPEAAPQPAAPQAVGAVLCSECGKGFAPNEVIRYGDRFVCASCKPIFLQKLQEGAVLGSGVPGNISDAQLLEREYRIDLASCLERAWEMFKLNAGPTIGLMLVMGAISVAAWMLTMLVGLVVPIVNGLITVLVTAPVEAGVLWYFLKLGRRENSTLRDGFAGFSSGFGQILLCALVRGLVQVVCMLPMAIVGMTAGFTRTRGGMSPEGQIGLVALFGVALCVGLAVMVYLETLWSFALLLIVDKRMHFWRAMELSRKVVRKRWWMTFLFFLVAGCIAGVGVLLCGVGLLATLPILFGMKACLYDDNFRDLAPSS